MTPDTELTLTFGEQRATVSPWGASLRRYYLIERDGAERDVVWGYHGAADKKGGQGDVLIPFPGRIADGRYVFEGRRYQLDCNDKEGPNAIHGFVRAIPWTIRGVSAAQVFFDVCLEAATYRDRGYPISLAITVSYTLHAGGLECSFSVHNIGDQPAPVGVGFHPYFTVGTATIDEAEAAIPAGRYLEFGDQLVPTGRVLPVEDTAWDFRRF